MRTLAAVCLVCAIAACRIGFDARGDGGGPGGGGGGGGDADGGDATLGTSRETYVKASNTDAGDAFGTAIALSGDGSTLVVGAPRESSAGFAAGQADNSAPAAGAAYVFVRDAAGVWSQQGYLKAALVGSGDDFGAAVAISRDGNTVVVGAPGEDSAATGIDGDGSDNSALDAGAAYVFVRDGTLWGQLLYLKASNTDPGDGFGAAVAISGDGDTVAVGAPGEDSSANDVDGSGGDNSASGAGAVYVFANGSAWSQQAYVKPKDSAAGQELGTAVALSATGGALAAGAPEQTGAGELVVFARAGAAWSEQASLLAANRRDGDHLGTAIAIAADGATLAGGAPFQGGSGAAYVYALAAGTWAQQAVVQATNADTGDAFADAVALAGDGATLAVGALNEHGGSTGCGGDQADNSAAQAGAGYVYARSGAAWLPVAYCKATNTHSDGELGAAIALAGDGATLALGAYGDASDATGIDGDGSDTSAPFAGAVYVVQ